MGSGSAKSVSSSSSSSSSGSSSSSSSAGEPLTCLGDCADNDPQPDAAVSGIDSGCFAPSSFSAPWDNFTETGTQCTWLWVRIDGGDVQNVAIILTKASGQIDVEIVLQPGFSCREYLAEDVGDLLVCSGEFISGTVTVPVKIGFSGSDATITFG